MWVLEASGGGYRLRHTITGERRYGPANAPWTRREATQEADRLTPSDRPGRALCHVCKKFIGGELIRCTCPPTTFGGMAADDLIAAIRTLATGAETRLRTVADTAQLDRLERKDLTFCREDLRSILVAVSELAAFLGAPTADTMGDLVAIAD